MTLQWFEIDREDCCNNEIVATYRTFTIALCCPNGGIVAITIWNTDKTIAETVDTEVYNKYGDEEWHIQQAKDRINQLLLPDNQLSLSM